MSKRLKFVFFLIFAAILALPGYKIYKALQEKEAEVVVEETTNEDGLTDEQRKALEELDNLGVE